MKIILRAIPSEDILKHLMILYEDLSLNLSGGGFEPHVYSVVVNGEYIGATTNDTDWLAQWSSDAKVVETLRHHWHNQPIVPILSASVARAGFVTRESKSKLTSSLHLFGRLSELDPFLHLSIEEYGIAPIGVPFFSNDLFSAMWSSVIKKKKVEGEALETELVMKAFAPFDEKIHTRWHESLNDSMELIASIQSYYLESFLAVNRKIVGPYQEEALQNLREAARQNWPFTPLGELLKLMGHA